MKDFVFSLIKYQFFIKHWILYLVIPAILSSLVIFLTESTKIKLVSDSTIWVTISIIWVTGWLLLNFLAILLTTNSTIVTVAKDKYENEDLYWTITHKIGAKKKDKKINFYDFIYYKVFFLVFFSISFIFVYIAYFLNFWIFLGS